jgi:class 3 adenylate cyclase
VHLDIKQSNINFSLGSKKRPFVYEDDCLYRYNHTQNLKGEIVSSDTSNYIIPVVDLDSLLIVKRIVKPFTDFYSLWIYRRQAAGLPFIPVKPIATIESSEVIKSALYTSDSTLILITYSGMYYYRSTELGYAKPTVSFQRVSLSSSTDLLLLHEGFIRSTSPLSKPKQQANCRNLRAIFSSNSSGDWRAGQNSVQFSSFLTGYDSNWSPWSSNNIRETNRLYPGKYTLSVKSRNFLGNESPVVFINFYVAPRFFEIPYFIVSFAFLGLLGLFLLYRWRGYSHAKVRFKLESLINTRTEELVKEKEKTDNLLARVLPKETATELKEKGRVNTQRFQVVTVLFCDIEGFTKITEETNPEVLIDQLDRFFLYFDSVVEKYRIEKIKTIGDAYMCAGGIPKKNRTNPVEVVLAALEMIQYMRDIVSQSELMQKVWDLRIGIDTGPVIAGVVGRNKLSYDIWGSTVNTASRMESSGEKGQINISGNTYMLVSDYFTCTYRGKMPVKNKGDIEMYFVDGIKPSLSIGFIGLEPNDKFQVQLQMIRLGDLEDFILEKLADGLPQNLYYHNLKHTIDVYTQVELIGRAENVTLEELLLLRTAALFHDAGHLIDYDTHEEMAVKLVREILPDFQYTERQIEIISSLIMSTKMPPKPMNLLEEIICDADLDYLGRTDFIPVSNELYRELHEHGKVGTLHEWNELQIRFIDKHSYFTKTARKLRNVNKQSQLDKLKEWMEKN